jgi:NAD-dependent SIR2 family protein deacetylase
MLTCQKCSKVITEKEALVHKDEKNEQAIICPDCFKAATGVDYKTFAFRKESAKQTFFAVIFCLAATIYAFIEKGPIYGVFGIAATILIYLFASKVK